VRLVARMPGSNRPTHVSPDGRTVLVLHERALMDSDLVAVDLVTGRITELTAGTTAPGRRVPGGVDDEGAVWLASDHLRDPADEGLLRAYRLVGDEWTPVGPDGVEVDELTVAAGTGAAALNDGGRSHLVLLDLATGGAAASGPLPLGVASELSLAPDASRLVFAFSGAASPGAVWQADVATGDTGRVTGGSCPVDPAGFVEPATVEIPSFDGLVVPALVYGPRAHGRAVISVHGGPESQERPRFQPVYQYLVSRGMAVVAPNVRGSTGYGRRYAGLDDGRRRPDAVADLAAVARWATAEFGTLPAVMGASYGGFMTLAGLTSYPDEFAAGVDIVGMADLVTFLERTGDYRRALREAEYGRLDRDRDFLAEVSPLRQVERISVPLLVIHGANDPRVPISEAEQIVEALRQRGREVTYLRFEDEGHGIVREDNRVTAYTAVADFLERHLG
jgi:dipeptidyl aminopeptidase/acylaminoacyl peptidase